MVFGGSGWKCIDSRAVASATTVQRLPQCHYLCAVKISTAFKHYPKFWVKFRVCALIHTHMCAYVCLHIFNLTPRGNEVREEEASALHFFRFHCRIFSYSFKMNLLNVLVMSWGFYFCFCGAFFSDDYCYVEFITGFVHPTLAENLL